MKQMLSTHDVAVALLSYEHVKIGLHRIKSGLSCSGIHELTEKWYVSEEKWPKPWCSPDFVQIYLAAMI